MALIVDKPMDSWVPRIKHLDYFLDPELWFNRT